MDSIEKEINVNEKEIWNHYLSKYRLEKYYIVPAILKKEHLLLMPRCTCQAKEILIKTNYDLDIQLQIVKDMNVALSFLQKIGIVHGDLHLENVLYEAKNNHFYLIDFGLSLHKSLCFEKNKMILYHLYLWSKEDHCRLFLHLYLVQHTQFFIQNNNYKKLRKQWRKFFTSNPKSWSDIKQKILKSFDFENQSDYLSCIHYFFSKILTNSKSLCIKSGIYEYDVLTKLYLDRLFLFTCIHFPECIHLKINPSKKQLFQTILLKFL